MRVSCGILTHQQFAKLLSLARKYYMRDIKALWFVNNICETGCAMATLGYARVSTQDQDLSGQIAALKDAGATTIYREKISGVRADRPQLGKLMAQIAPGDIVLVTKLD